jgi:hypothetical protein
MAHAAEMASGAKSQVESDLVLVVHALKATAAPVKLGGPVGTRINGAFLTGADSRSLLMTDPPVKVRPMRVPAKGACHITHLKETHR